MQRSIGSVFAGYRIDAVAGRGGMGIVYRATQVALGRPVALKLVAPGLAHEHSYRERFTRELRLVASIDHPNVIPVYHAGEEEGQLFVAMRWVEGTDLHALIAREGRLEPARTAGIVGQVAAALDAAHRGGIVHRDVKPANVLMAGGADDRVYLSDFGLSKHSTSAGGLTAHGQWVGTPDYIAPEQIRGISLDARCDVYSLGCVLFHALTGSPPFPEEGDAAKLWAHMTEPPPSVVAQIPSIPEGLDEVVKRAMAKDPDERYGSAGELGRAVLDAAEQEAATQLDGAGATELEGNLDRTVIGRTEAVEDAPATSGGHTEIGEPPATSGGHTDIGEPPATSGGHTEIGEPPATSGGHPPERSEATVAPPPEGEAGRPPRVAARLRGRLPLTIAAAVLALGVAAAVLWSARGPEDAPAPRAIAVGQNPTAVDFGAGGVWVANYGSGTVSRIDPSTNRPDEPIDAGESPEDVAVGEGGVWVSNAFGALTRIEPRSNRVADDPIQLGADPYAVAAGGGSVWVANGLEDTVTRVDPEFNRVVGRPIRVGNTPTAVAVGGGSVWVANSDSATVTRIDDRSGEVVGEPISVGNGPAAVAVGEGAVWVANSDSNSVTRIDARSGEVMGRPIAVGRAPTGVAVDDGAVWVANSESNSVTRIDARSGEVMGGPIAAGTGPTAVTVGGGAVWVTNSASDRVTRIDR